MSTSNEHPVQPMRTFVSELHPAVVEHDDDTIHVLIERIGEDQSVRDTSLWKAGQLLIVQDDPDIQRIGYSLALRAGNIEPAVVNNSILADIYDVEDGYGLSEALDREARRQHHAALKAKLLHQ